MISALILSRRPTGHLLKYANEGLGSIRWSTRLRQLRRNLTMANGILRYGSVDERPAMPA